MGAVLVVAALFYGLLPLIGAWRLRMRWARFRQLVLTANTFPDLDFPRWQAVDLDPSDPVCLVGQLEAFEGRGRLWIGNDRVSAAVDLGESPVYFLDEPGDGATFGLDPPRRADAASLGALAEGTKFLVAGSLTRDGRSQPRFEPVPGQDLLVLAFEGEAETVLTRAMYAGRPPVDHWNAWTPLAAAVGILFLMGFSYVGLTVTADRRVGLAALALALLPATAFLPPGLVFFYWFMRWWNRGRECRAWADLSRLGGGSPDDQRRWSRTGLGWELAAQAALGAGLVANGALAVALLRTWMG